MVPWEPDKEGYDRLFKVTLLVSGGLLVTSLGLEVCLNSEASLATLSLSIAVLAVSFALLTGRDLKLVKEQYDEIERKLDDMRYLLKFPDED